MPRREGESYSLRENEAGSNKTAVAAGESGLRQDLIERSFLLCLFQKQPHCFHEILLGLDLGRCTGREIKFRRVRNVHLSFFEHLTRKSPTFIIGTFGRNDKLKVCAISQSSHRQ